MKLELYIEQDFCELSFVLVYWYGLNNKLNEEPMTELPSDVTTNQAQCFMKAKELRKEKDERERYKENSYVALVLFCIP